MYYLQLSKLSYRHLIEILRKEDPERLVYEIYRVS